MFTPGRLIAITLLLSSVVAAAPATRPAEAPWSEASNGLRGRLSVRRDRVCNGTALVVAYLELGRVGGVANPMLVNGHPLRYIVTDADGHEVKRYAGIFDGMIPDGTNELVLPVECTIRFRIGWPGYGIPGNQAALLDLGAQDAWVFPRDGKHYYLQSVMEIAPVKDRVTDRGVVWSGKLELPRVLIPTEPTPVDPETVGPLIEDLGAQMLASRGDRSEAARRQLSLIDDARVIPWYVKAMKTDSYSLKFEALDRLSRFAGDEALAGLKIGMTTQGADIGNCTTEKVAAESAEQVRHCAALALAGSPHPQAKALLWTMEQDPAKSVRLTVIQTAANVQTPEALDILKRGVKDSDETVRTEAARLLKECEDKAARTPH